ncbi:hypothetical protein F5148DRAFT_745906 [Russula earlei]|uniref:Uncharacterized protein n=1 Tax=Russula earlei TaxID=71964 RepID=A0ACC0UD11_9AGAM|nr:hypothetical protein F5148DRAFT_745906 [Russula earlei]
MVCRAQTTRLPLRCQLRIVHALSLDKGKGKEIAYSPEAGRSTSRINDGKGNAVVPLFDPATLGHHLADEEIFSPGAAAQRRLAGLRSTDPPQANIFSAGPRGNDLLSSMLGMSSGRDIDGPSTGFRMGARPTGSLIGSVGSSGLSSSSNRFGGGRLGRSGDLDDMGSLGDGVNGLSSLLGNVSRLGAYTSREGARGAENDGDNNETDNVDSLFIPSWHLWGGTGIQSKLSNGGV